jgi:tetratricopeptide (TPR) repeat protein
LLAQIFQSKNDFAKASKYLREALASETDTAERGKLLVRIGILEFSTKNYSAAVKSFNESLGTGSGNEGLAYFFLAQCYVAGSGGCGGGIAGRAVYWYAYDLVSKAIPLLEATDANVAAQARALAGRYRAAFPSSEECFFAELGQGATYVIGCGMAKGKSTKVRY